MEDVRPIRDDVLGGQIDVGDVGLHEVKLVIERFENGIVRQHTGFRTAFLLRCADQLTKPELAVFIS